MLLSEHEGKQYYKLYFRNPFMALKFPLCRASGGGGRVPWPACRRGYHRTTLAQQGGTTPARVPGSRDPQGRGGGGRAVTAAAAAGPVHCTGRVSSPELRIFVADYPRIEIR